MADIDTMHAMTIHKSQGNAAGEVSVRMPQTNSRLLTRAVRATGPSRRLQDG